VQKSRPTQNKRARERARQEKQQMKTARRLEAKSRKPSSSDGSGEDPDIAGIVPGPQRSAWADMGDVNMEPEPDEVEEEEVEKTGE
jgi:hypothetical protein